MTKRRRWLHLNVFLAHTGHHEGSWRHPRADPARAATADHYIELARMAEAAEVESVFMADNLSTAIDVEHAMPRNFEPSTLLGALAACTSRIGLIGTASTTFAEPYNVARVFASLDHISGGRAGWNIVTTAENRAAANFGLAANWDHAERYQRADEFLHVVKRLWDSWQDDAIVADPAAGRYADPRKVHAVRHSGRYFRVHGPLNIARSAQGHPLLVQAGSSESGRAFAARHAEVAFAVHQDLGDARAFYADLKSRVASAGRDPEHVKILPGIVPIVGDTEKAAHTYADELDDLIVMPRAIAALEERLGISLAGHDLDAPLPSLLDATAFNGQQGRYRVIMKLAEHDNLSVRDLVRRLAGGRGHHTVAGTPEQVADRLQMWFEAKGADGFTVMPALLPEGLEHFLGQVVPILRRRGIMSSGYIGTTAREHYGIPSPAAHGRA